jgi:hypothetical protein
MTIACMVLGADAQHSLPPPSEPKDVCQRLLAFVREGKVSDAIAVSQAASFKCAHDEGDWNLGAATVEHHLKAFRGTYGEPLGWELVQENRANETLRRYVYLFKYETNVLCWAFIFYRPHNDWKLISWHYSESLDSLWSSSSVGQGQDPRRP